VAKLYFLANFAINFALFAVKDYRRNS